MIPAASSRKSGSTGPGRIVASVGLAAVAAAALLGLPGLSVAAGGIVPVPGEGYGLKLVAGKPSADGTAGGLGFLMTVTTGNRFLAIQVMFRNMGARPVELSSRTLLVADSKGAPVAPMKPRVYMPIRFNKVPPIPIDDQGNPTEPGPTMGLADGGLDAITAEKPSSNRYLEGVRLSREEAYCKRSLILNGGPLAPGERRYEKIILQRNQMEPPFSVTVSDGVGSTMVNFGREP